MKNLSIIACVSADRGLGNGNELLWHFRDDMKFFRETTSGATVVMGSKTFASIGRPLPKRRNIVLSRRDLPADNVTVLHSEAELRKYLSSLGGEIFIIGGATLYDMFIRDAEKIYLTEVAATQPADAYFPEFDKTKFSRRVLATHGQDGIKYQIVEYAKGCHD